MSFCDQCTEHPGGMAKGCYHGFAQFTNEYGRVKSRILACPKFNQAYASMSKYL
ncbi:hypothetical protein [uncultured Methanolobus sp.]|uniref:hypothetical protein n=1 Tax=uncultured Methanolobus sp. TaxID=218300 RepID=UPI0029C690F6|nr:hypothetical protein [uncultured Methanolobus sp.]